MSGIPALRRLRKRNVSLRPSRDADVVPSQRSKPKSSTDAGNSAQVRSALPAPQMPTSSNTSARCFPRLPLFPPAPCFIGLKEGAECGQIKDGNLRIIANYGPIFEMGQGSEHLINLPGR